MKRTRVTHWMTNTRIYNIYRWIISRCNIPSMTNYEIYWWRWIKCLWKTFEEFYEDMWESYYKHVEKYWEKNTTIDRINVNWHYCKENCRWATIKEQWNNTRLNIKVVYKWKEYPSLQLLCEDLWLKYPTIYKRAFLEGQDIIEAIDDIINKRNKYVYKWVIYKWITDMCRQLWLKRTSIAYRLSIWMSIDEAIEAKSYPLIDIDWKNGKPL